MTAVPDFTTARVLVMGDVMLDRYWQGPTGRISPEAPVPVVRISDTEDRPGGAANVALNLRALGANVTLVGVVGSDEPAGRLRDDLCEAGIDCRFVASTTHPTITKLRVISRNQQLIRLDFEEPLDHIGAYDQSALMTAFEAALPNHDVVLLSDYAKGTLAGAPALIKLCRAAGVPVLVDPKGQDFDRYRGASLLTPNLSEFEAVAGVIEGDEDLSERAESLRARLELDALLVTRSEQGMSLIRPDVPPVHMPTHAREVYDVTGAGDTVIALLAASLAAGQDFAQSAHLANLGAGIVVGKLGTASVNTAELLRAVRQQHQDDRGILDEDSLLSYVEAARAQGETVVMTNGCFDILHPGHVRYLEEARKLGDCLIVAVNDDDSVRRLKGASRPINPVEHRMQVLAGLRAVDWVVPFAEDTPERLICRLRPNLLVKGGDYKAEDIAGYDCVTDAGGEVLILTFHDGFSTTRIIEAVNNTAES